MSLRVLEELAREEEHRLRDRYTIGHVSGLKAAVLVVRQGRSLEEEISEVSKRQHMRGMRDAFDVGYLDALQKALALTKEEQ